MLKLAENLKALRLKQELTQEQLADVFGVSAQAVSRWENEATYPDITLLPTIATYFEVTVDELIGMENFKSEEQLKAFWDKYNDNASKGMVAENIRILREALKQYPNNYKLMYELVWQLGFYQYETDGKALNEEQLKLNRTEAIELGNRVLSHCTDPQITNATIKQMCYLYKWQNDDEKAIEYAKKLPCIWDCSTTVLGDVYADKDIKEHLQLSTLACVEAVYFNLRNLADLEYKDNLLSTEERILIIQKAISFFELIFDEKDYLYHSIYVSQCHRYIAAMAMLNGNHELALSSLENAAELAIMSDTLPEYAEHTSLLVNKLHCSVLETRKNYNFSNCKELFDKMQWDRYNAIRDEKRFTDVLAKIREHC